MFAEKVTPIFYRLFRSYALISVVPLTLVLLVLMFSGELLITTFVRYNQEQRIELSNRLLQQRLEDVRYRAYELQDSPLIRRGITGEAPALDVYETLFTAYAGFLRWVDVHVGDVSGQYRFSTTVMPERYEGFKSPIQSDPVPYLAPGNTHDGVPVAVAYRFPVHGPGTGFLVVELRVTALQELLEMPSSASTYLVDPQQLRTMSLSQPLERASFTDLPGLGIALTGDTTWQPDRETLVFKRQLDDSGLSLVSIMRLGGYFEALRGIIVAVVGLVVIFTTAILVFSYRLSKTISEPIHTLVENMTSPNGPRRLSEDNLSNARDELYQLQAHYNEMVETIEHLIEKVRQEEHAQRLAERKALQAQIQPHFLYNTLGSIKSMARLGDSQTVVTMVTDLGKILRYLLTDTETMVSLEESIDLIERYLNLQKLRFGSRLIVNFKLDSRCNNAVVPKLLIQPLVENAINHAVEKSVQPVTITLVTLCSGEDLYVRVEDDGPGISINGKSEGFGIGIPNLQQRLELIYSDRGSFHLYRRNWQTIGEIRIKECFA
jgi:two-component system sensor histidine kinase YesM